MPLKECNETMSNYFPFFNVPALENGISGKYYCAYDTASRNEICQEDNAAILQYFSNSNARVATVVGVNYFSLGCGSNLPAVYTRIAPFVDWIEEIVWD